MSGTTINSRPALDQSITTPPSVALASITKTTQEMSDPITKNETKQDDWTPPIDDCEYNLQNPSFIRLFFMRRILHKYMIDNTQCGAATGKVVEHLVSTLNDSGEEIKKTAKDIVTRLVDDGIQVYMDKWYNEKQESNIIEMIFNKIILKNFDKEYNKLVTYSNNKDGNVDMKYQRLLFNSNDLMSYIFQYLELYHRIENDDSYMCSLVDSHWLYHVWNVNSVYFVDLDVLIQKTLGYKEPTYTGISLNLYVLYTNCKFVIKEQYDILGSAVGDSDDDSDSSDSSDCSSESSIVNKRKNDNKKGDVKNGSDNNNKNDLTTEKENQTDKDKNDDESGKRAEKEAEEQEDILRAIEMEKTEKTQNTIEKDKEKEKEKNVDPVNHDKIDTDVESLLKMRHENDEIGNDKRKLIMRTWQRLINAKSIHIRWRHGYEKEEYNDIILNKLLLLKNIENIDLFIPLHDTHIRSGAVLKTILFKSHETIKWCKMQVCWLWPDENKENQLPPLKFPNSTYMEICDSYFYRIWSFKCKELTLDHLILTQNWCNFAINNCNCTKIHTLKIQPYLRFDKSIIINASPVQIEKVAYLKQFALKFSNLKRLIIEYGQRRPFDENELKVPLLLFLQLFESVILENNVRIELCIGVHATHDNYVYLMQLIDKYSLKINKLHIENGDDYRNKCDDETIIDLIKKCDDNGGLKRLHIYLKQSFREKLMKKVLFKSIKVLSIHGGGLDFLITDLIGYLSLDVVFEKKLFVNVYNLKFWDCMNKSWFDKLCQTIHQLFVKQIPIDIYVIFQKFHIVKELDLDSQLCFETEQFLSQYKKPQCQNNPFCSPCQEPCAAFYPLCLWHNGYCLSVLQASNCEDMCV